jgi:hypothetical protein
MARKKGGGGKLNRSEIVQARLDPKLHMAAEIMARSDRRTLSSFIEKLIEQSAKTHKVKRNLFQPWWSDTPEYMCHEKIYSKYDVVTVDQAIHDIGYDHEAIQFFNYAIAFPDLLNKNEHEMLMKILFNMYFWLHYPVDTEEINGNILHKDWVRVDSIEGLIRDHLVEYWDDIKSNKIIQEALFELPVGRKIPAPLKSDPRAIKKRIKTNDTKFPYKDIFMWAQDGEIELSVNDSFWKKHSKNLVTDKIEIKKTHDGHQIVAIMSLPIDKDEQNEWIEFYKKKMDDLSNVD